MHNPPFDNKNQPIVDANDALTPLVFFNILKLAPGESITSQVAGYETCIVPATGGVSVEVEGFSAEVGYRGTDVWDGEPSGVYVPVGRAAKITARTQTEIFVAGAKFDEVYEPFAVQPGDIDPVQYGSDDTKTHRKIKHILGQNPPGRVGRLLVSELYTVGAGGWSGFPPHKHDTDRAEGSEEQKIETRHDEVYNFRFRPGHGFGMQLLQREDGGTGEAYHITDGSTFQIDNGYHPCVAAPGYEMYYFTILGGLSQRPLVQFFQPTHAYQVETIPGIKDMVAKFK